MAGKLQNEDFKTESELTSAGGSASQLLNDTKIWVTGNSINKTLDDAIVDGDIGGGSGGGGSLDIFKQQNLEDLDATSYDDSGNNATFNNGGTLDGTLADETTNPISGSQSGKYTAGSSSTNDWFTVETITLDDKQKGVDVGVTLYADMSSMSSDVRFVVYDETNSEVITDSLDILEADTGLSRYEFKVFIPSSTATISYGFHMVDAPTNNDSFIFDDIEFSADPFVFKELIEEQEIVASAAQNTLLDRNAQVRFDSGDFTKTGANIISIEDDSGNTRTKFVANKKCVLKVAWAPISGASGEISEISKFNSAGANQFTHRSVSAGASGEYHGATASYVLDKDEFVTVGTSGTVQNGAGAYKLVMVAQAESENIVTPAKSIKQYSEADGDFTVTGTNWTTTRAVAVPYKTSEGIWRMTLNIQGTFSSGVTSETLTISGVTFKSSFFQALAVENTFNDGVRSRANGGGGTLDIGGNSSSSNWRVSGDVELDSQPTWAEDTSNKFLAAIPHQIKYQTKKLTSDVTTDTTVSDLTFNNLTIGKKYRVFLQARFEVNGDAGAFVQIKHDGSIIGSVGAGHTDATGEFFHVSTDAIFEASATTLTFDTVSIAASSALGGNDDFNQTYARLEELASAVEVSEWT